MTAFTLLPQRFASWMAGAVAAIGVFLAALGIHGLAAYNVGRRTREISIRMALGALRAQVMGSVVASAALLAGIGMALGLAAASFVTTLLTGLLYGIDARDPASFAGSAVVFTGVVVIASLVPARRAASVNPVDALRAE